jgi:hypothetical protein
LAQTFTRTDSGCLVGKQFEKIMNAGFEFAGFILGIVGAVWLKASMSVLNRGGNRQQRLSRREEDPAVTAFMKGLSLILLGFGIETVARLFLN